VIIIKNSKLPQLLHRATSSQATTTAVNIRTTTSKQPIPTQPINSNNNKQTTTDNITNARQTRLKPDQHNHGTKC
jgi:hypothetical protein